jgi:hypothetical protein
MVSRTLQAELDDIHRQIDRLQRRDKVEPEEMEELRSRLRHIERHLGLDRDIAA